MGTQKTVSDMAQPLAVLVDGDNIGGKNAASILGIAIDLPPAKSLTVM